MERFVELVAPRNIFDLIFKAAMLLLMLGSLNLLRDIVDYGSGHDGFWNNLYEAAFVGAPFVVLALVSFRHMNTLHIKLARLAATDMLTGLPNRRAFVEIVDEGLPGAIPDVLMMVDVDHFKKVNDTFGHAVGDLCLRQLADFMREQVRSTDVVARMGGEEFAVLLKNATLSEAKHVADRIARGRTIKSGGTEFILTTSVGYTRRNRDEPIDMALSLADGALYLAKTGGRAQACLAEDSPAPDQHLSDVA